MSKRKTRIPKIGDRMAAKGQKSAFPVYGINSDRQRAENKLTESSD